MDKRSRAARKTSLSRIIVGIRKHFRSVEGLVVASRPYTPAELAGRFQKELDTILAVEQLEAQRKKGRLNERQAYKDNRPTHAAFEQLVRGSFADARQLADFGYKPERPRKNSVSVKKEALAKAKATRDARRTMGSQQRKKTRG